MYTLFVDIAAFLNLHIPWWVQLVCMYCNMAYHAEGEKFPAFNRHCSCDINKDHTGNGWDFYITIFWSHNMSHSIFILRLRFFDCNDTGFLTAGNPDPCRMSKEVLHWLTVAELSKPFVEYTINLVGWWVTYLNWNLNYFRRSLCFFLRKKEKILKIKGYTIENLLLN